MGEHAYLDRIPHLQFRFHGGLLAGNVRLDKHHGLHPLCGVVADIDDGQEEYQVAVDTVEEIVDVVVHQELVQGFPL